MPHCPLCECEQSLSFCQDRKRDYWQCQTCQLVWVPRDYHLSSTAEKAEYDKHENSLTDAGYLKFLSRVSSPLVKRLSQPSKGLDFGCGPAPALAEQLKLHGHSVALYDLYYFPDSSVLTEQYDFITCTEVIEHIAHPAVVFEQWMKCLKPEGILAIMTKRVIDQSAFQNWHYKNDPTHICFYSEATFEWLANRWNLTLEIIDQDVVFLLNSKN